jgi:hypothetical protein
MIFDRMTSKLVLLALTDESTLQSYYVDVLKQEMTEKHKVSVPAEIISVHRTSKYFALQQKDSVKFLLATDLSQHVVLSHAPIVQFSILDDVVLVHAHGQTPAKFFNVVNGKHEVLPNIVNHSDCAVSRVEESENVDIKVKDSIAYAVQCNKFLGLFSLTVEYLEIEALFKTQGLTLGSK